MPPGVLQLREADHWDEWRQDCLACLLQLLIQISVLSPEEVAPAPATAAPAVGGPSVALSPPDQAKKKAKRQRKWDKFAVMKLSPVCWSLGDDESSSYCEVT